MEIKPKNFRVLSGSPEAMEHELNRLLDEYTLVSHAFHVVDGKVVMSAFMMHISILNRQALAQAVHRGPRQ